MAVNDEPQLPNVGDDDRALIPANKRCGISLGPVVPQSRLCKEIATTTAIIVLQVYATVTALPGDASRRVNVNATYRH